MWPRVVEVGGMQPEARAPSGPGGWERQGKAFSWSLQRERSPASSLISDFGPPERERMCVVRSASLWELVTVATGNQYLWDKYYVAVMEGY